MPAEPADLRSPSGVFETLLEVRWRDLDSLRHVNNSVYFSYFEEARVHLFARAHPESFGRRAVVLAHTSCDFLRPLLYPAFVVVGLKLTHAGHSSLEIESELRDAKDRQLVYARGRNVVVGVDTQTQRPIPWTPEELQALQRCFE